MFRTFFLIFIKLILSPLVKYSTLLFYWFCLLGMESALIFTFKFMEILNSVQIIENNINSIVFCNIIRILEIHNIGNYLTIILSYFILLFFYLQKQFIIQFFLFYYMLQWKHLQTEKKPMFMVDIEGLLLRNFTKARHCGRSCGRGN